jgi:hypothetical protein
MDAAHDVERFNLDAKDRSQALDVTGDTPEQIRKKVYQTINTLHKHLDDLHSYTHSRFAGGENLRALRAQIRTSPALACGMALAVGCICGALGAHRPVLRTAGRTGVQISTVATKLIRQNSEIAKLFLAMVTRYSKRP